MDSDKARRILIVDDNRAIHDDFRKILGRNVGGPQHLNALEAELFDEAPKSSDDVAASFEVSSAYQGQEALAMVTAALERDEAFAMAFVDMRMPPGWDGVTTIEKLWAIDPHLQVVICTAYSDYSWEEILARLGMNDRLLLLKKPFDTAEVCQLAAALTEKWHLARHAHLKLAQLRGMVGEKTRDLEETNQRLQASEERYALAAAGANDGLWDWEPAKGAIYYSPRYKEMLGYAYEPLGDGLEAWFTRIHPDDRSVVVENFAPKRTSGDASQFAVEYRILHKDGQYRWVLCRGLIVREPNGDIRRAAGSQTDITDRKMAEAQLRYEAFHDVLTGLPNRALLSERIERCLTRQTREPDFKFAVMFIDLDHFKVINDSLGHLVGDGLLIALAKRFSECVRNAHLEAFSGPDNLARVGGDEFVLLLEGVHSEVDATRMAERLLASVAEPLNVAGQRIHASLSIGMAMADTHYARVDEVLRDADLALYRAKAEGRGCARIFTDDLRTAAMKRWQIESDLRLAIDAGELFLQYQPVVDLFSGEVRRFEALARWNHPTRGLIPPADFIPLAEECGLILPLGRFVLEAACRQVCEWREGLPGQDVSVAVNVSNRQFAAPGFVAEVKAILAKTGADASAIRIEVTESATMSATAMATCEELRTLGLQLYLDDFGTGYSSLSYLHRMPIQALKIDRSFISGIGKNAMSTSIVQAILALAWSLGIRAIAEGVETKEQVELLASLGCEAGQGYLWSKPVNADAAFEIARAQPFVEDMTALSLRFERVA